MPAVSVIIPVYNVRPYLAECLDSVLGQDLVEVEVICVDDGSTDGSQEVLARYAADDPRICVIRGTHRGPGAARNLGLARAQGEYLAFVDSDDRVERDIWTASLACARSNDADLVLFDIDRFGNARVEREPFGREPSPFRSPCYPVNRLVRRDLWGETRFPEDVLLGEDMLPHIQVSLMAKKVARLGRTLYHYRQRPGSSMDAARERHAADHLTNAAAVFDWLVVSGRREATAAAWSRFAYDMVNLTYKYARSWQTVRVIRAWCNQRREALLYRSTFALRHLLRVLATGSDVLFVLNWWLFHALRGLKKVVMP